MKYFSDKTILDALKNSKIEDSFLALMCVCKILHFNHQLAYTKWMTFDKANLSRELIYYFDFDSGKTRESENTGSLSIVFAKNFTTAFGKINPVYLAAVCFRKYGIPDEINTVNDLVNHIKFEFCLTDAFCNDVFELDGIALPDFDENFQNEAFEKMLKEQNNIENEEGFFAISCGPKPIIKNSAGNLGAAYFQTLYSKMPSKVCLITEFPNEYSYFDKVTPENNGSIEDRKTDFILWLAQNGPKNESNVKRMVRILESGLAKEIEAIEIGNLFRCENSLEYEEKKSKIISLDDWEKINDEKFSNGYARTALNHYSNFLKDFEQQNSLGSNPPRTKPLSPAQIIYYGVPGCGKSNKIREELKSVSEFQKIRCVFHPEYTNADFIGQVKPCSDNGKIEYNFTPGPFAKILRRAYLNPGLPFYLEIEEINRGNAAAIFGEVFQLCDRIKPEDEKDEQGFGVGWSAYSIENADLSDYIRDIAALDADNAESHSTAVTQKRSYSEIKDSEGSSITSDATSYISLEISRSDFDNGILHFSENSGIRLPPNLNIYATMNTSDQNVFTLDNAFQRRFDMELVRNEFADDEKSKAQQNAIIEGIDSTWGDFWQKINDKIVKLNHGLASTEDKRLGPWFVSSVAGDSTDSPRKISAKTFAEKVLKYLWDDAFKFKRPQAFAEGLTSLEQVVKKFEDTSISPSEKLKSIFKDF